MAHNIFDSRIYLHRKPAWHRLGIVSDEAHSAVAAGQMIGLPEVYERPVKIDLGDGKYLDVAGQKAILGVTQQEDQQRIETYSIVSDHYQTLTHRQFTELFDRITHSRVESLGLLGNGSTMFLTAPMPGFDVKGDEIHNYLLMYNSLDGVSSIRCQPTSIRVVCQNTLQAAFVANSTNNVYRGVHLSTNLMQRTAEWLHQTWNQVSGITELLQEAYNAMANFAVRPDDIATTIEQVYGHETEEEEDESAADSLHFQAIMELFEGSKTRTPACVGTAWGLYNAVVEYEDFAKKRTTASSILVGSGSERKKQAFRKLHEMSVV